jgi:histidine triad (HIT) family protein
MSCLFCRIVAGEIPSTIVHRDAEVVAFRDIAPKAPVHILFVPTRHYASLAEALDSDADVLGRLLLRVRDVARAEGLDGNGYRVVTNVGEHAGQSVFHLHVHLLGGRDFSWPPG